MPDHPVIPFIIGDGTGPDIYGRSFPGFGCGRGKGLSGQAQNHVARGAAGEKAFNLTGEWLPQQTLDVIRDCIIAIKGPLTTPVGGGIRPLTWPCARSWIFMFACARCAISRGAVAAERPEDTDMVIFRENTEDIYAGIEYPQGSPEVKKLIEFPQRNWGKQDTLPESSGIGIKPVSETGSKRLIRAAIKYALENKRSSVTLVHKEYNEVYRRGI